VSGEVLDQIELAQFLQAPEQRVDQARDAGLEPAHHRGTERLDDGPPHARVVGRIVENQLVV